MVSSSTNELTIMLWGGGRGSNKEERVTVKRKHVFRGMFYIHANKSTTEYEKFPF